MVGRYVYCVNTELYIQFKRKVFSDACTWWFVCLFLSMNYYKRNYDLWRIRANIDSKPIQIT